VSLPKLAVPKGSVAASAGAPSSELSVLLNRYSAASGAAFAVPADQNTVKLAATIRRKADGLLIVVPLGITTSDTSAKPYAKLVNIFRAKTQTADKTIAFRMLTIPVIQECKSFRR
jgi:hypothetical protein